MKNDVKQHILNKLTCKYQGCMCQGQEQKSVAVMADKQIVDYH